jgi:hypothetical protein
VQFFVLSAGMMAIVPPAHGTESTPRVTVMTAMIPGEHIDLDVDDPRRVERKIDLPRLRGGISAAASWEWGSLPRLAPLIEGRR